LSNIPNDLSKNSNLINHQRGYSNDDPSIMNKFKKKNGRLVNDHLGQIIGTGMHQKN
jgi:hypothetical protein